jgi:predicted Zn-dependent protease
MFYHPGMKLQFPVPTGWAVTNQPQEVRLSPEEGDAVLVFRVAEGLNPFDAATKFAVANQVTVGESKQISVNGTNGVLMTGELTSGDEKTAITSYFLPLGKSILAFHGLAPATTAATFAPAFVRVATGLRTLTNRSALNVSPKRIEVRSVSKAATLQAAFNGWGLPLDRVEELSILNGLALKDNLGPGTRIKIAG